MLEAARWAPTWGRRQPVRFVVGLRGDDTFATIADLLRRGNSYAKAASALILLCSDEGEDDRTRAVLRRRRRRRHGQPDHRGGIARADRPPDGRIRRPEGRRGVRLPDGLRPLVVIAVGSPADYATVAAEIADRDRQPRERLPLSDIVLNRT